MIVTGREELTLSPSPEAEAQLALRYDLAATCADTFASAGFDAIVQDVIIGRELAGFIERIRSRERYLVVLSPSVSVLEWREKQRDKTGYRHMSPGALDTVLRQETLRIGYWLDSSAQEPHETVRDILANLEQARV